MDTLVSVVVPTYHRPQLLKKCLLALYHQDLPSEVYEIIVADDGSSDDTRAMVTEFMHQYPSGPDIRYVAVSARHGPAAARNCGWQRAKSPLIAFTDDDCQPKPDWLSAGLRVMSQGADAAWGKLVMPVAPQPTDYEKDASQLAHAEFVTANCFCKKEVLKNVGGFDERFRLAWREDSDLFFKLLDAGCRIDHASAAVVVHPVRAAAWGVSISQQRKIIFDALLYKKHPRHYRSRIRASPPLAYYAIVLSLLGVIGGIWSHAPRLGALSGILWIVLTMMFMLKRLAGTSRSFSHILEMAITSVVIPPLALYWHWRGALKFQIVYF